MTDPTCSWCAHPSHPHPCPGSILTRAGKKPDYQPCPCRRALTGPRSHEQPEGGELGTPKHETPADRHTAPQRKDQA